MIPLITTLKLHFAPSHWEFFECAKGDPWAFISPIMYFIQLVRPEIYFCHSLFASGRERTAEGAVRLFAEVLVWHRHY